MKKRNEKKLVLNRLTLANLNTAQAGNMIGETPMGYVSQNIDGKTEASTCAKRCC